MRQKKQPMFKPGLVIDTDSPVSRPPPPVSTPAPTVQYILAAYIDGTIFHGYMLLVYNSLQIVPAYLFVGQCPRPPPLTSWAV